MKKRNIIKRNSGFIVGCVLVGGASFFAADVVMTDVLPDLHLEKETDEPQSDTEAVLQPEKKETVVYETDPFTVMASGSVIKGVESEQSEKQSETQQSESGEPEDGQTSGDDSAGTDGETNPDGEYTSDGDDSYFGDSSQSVEIYDSGNGDYTYTDDGSWSGDGSGGSDGSWADGSGDGGWSDGSGDSGWTDNGSWGGDGSGDSGWTDNGSWSGDGSGSSDGSWADGSGGSDGDWSDGSGGDNGSGDDGSGTDGAWTPEDVIIQGISSRYIDVSELYNYNQGQLRLIRNEIFALHGRIFNSQDLADYFSQKSWYVPTYPPEEFDANMFYYLNDYEEANLQVILDYEAALGY